VNALDFSVQLFKIGWIKHCLNALWFYIPKFIFEKFKGLQFVLSCDFKCNKRQVKLVNFHKQALEACMLAFHHNFSS